MVIIIIIWNVFWIGFWFWEEEREVLRVNNGRIGIYWHSIDGRRTHIWCRPARGSRMRVIGPVYYKRLFAIVDRSFPRRQTQTGSNRSEHESAIGLDGHVHSLTVLPSSTFDDEEPRIRSGEHKKSTDEDGRSRYSVDQRVYVLRVFKVWSDSVWGGEGPLDLWNVWRSHVISWATAKTMIQKKSSIDVSKRDKQIGLERETFCRKELFQAPCRKRREKAPW